MENGLWYDDDNLIVSPSKDTYWPSLGASSSLSRPVVTAIKKTNGQLNILEEILSIARDPASASSSAHFFFHASSEWGTEIPRCARSRDFFNYRADEKNEMTQCAQSQTRSNRSIGWELLRLGIFFLPPLLFSSCFHFFWPHFWRASKPLSRIYISTTLIHRFCFSANIFLFVCLKIMRRLTWAAPSEKAVVIKPNSNFVARLLRI